MSKELKHLLNKVNKVSAYHRHGTPVPPNVLDDLANAQLNYEQAIKHNTTKDDD